MSKLQTIATKSAAAVAVVVGLAAQAHADLPAAATSAFTSISSDAGDLIDLAWPVVLLITGGMITISLFKKFAKKAAS